MIDKKSLEYYYLNVFKPTFEKELDNYFLDTFNCNATIKFFVNGEGYFNIEPIRGDSTFFKFCFYNSNLDVTASPISHIKHIKFVYYSISDGLLKISSNKFESLGLNSSVFDINWGNYKNPTSVKQHTKELSDFVINMLGLNNNYDEFLKREIKTLSGEEIF